MNDQELLEKWYDAKQQISELEDKIEKYKKIADNIMDHKNTDTLSCDKYTLSKKDMNKTSISKKDLPIEIWEKYSKESFYSAFYLSKNNEKRKRSVKRSKKRVL
jgi:hypothetical protein